MDNKINDQINIIINYCNDSNVPMRNLHFHNFLPPEIEKIWRELENNDEIDTFKLWKVISENIRIDNDKMCKYYLWDIATEEKNNLLFERYPRIKELIDKNGMVELPYPCDLNKNSFKHGYHYLIIDDSFSSNFHFTEWLIKNWQGKFKLRLPIKLNSLGIGSTRRNVALMSHWQGPKTLDNIKGMYDKEAYVVYGPDNFSSSLIDSTQFFFYFKDNKWQLEVEELVPMDGMNYSESKVILGIRHKFYTKYLHAFVNLELTKCYHIDGGIRVYADLNDFKKRNSMQLNSDKAIIKDMTKRYKIFRIDSDKGIDSYQEIVGLFFNSNPYVSQFFEGKNKFNKDIEDRRSTMLELDLKQKGF